MSKIITITVKIAGLVITAPVTWSVAGLVFRDVQPNNLRLLVQIAALVVVEGVFLASWLALDGDKSAPDAVRVRHAITALAMYLGLWVLAIQHGEGLAGIVFRLALGLALVGSIYDAGIVSGLRRDAAADRDIAKDWRVKRHARNIARQDAIAELDAAQQLKALERDARLSIETARIALDKSRGMSTVKADHRASIEEPKGKFPMPIDKTRGIRDALRATRKAHALDTIQRAVIARPGVTQKELADMIGISRQSVSGYLGELVYSGRLTRTGAGEYSLPDAMPMNGNGHNY